MNVVTAAQAAARDAKAIEAGTPSSALMSRAGAAAADALRRHAGDRMEGGVAVFAGAGNNGGDAWVVAGALRRTGAVVRVFAAGNSNTDDAKRARAEAVGDTPFELPHGDETCAVDGLLGTGAAGEPRGAVAGGLEQLEALRAQGAFVLALDVPSGLDATTGSAVAQTVAANITITFGTLKRGLVINRSLAGIIEVADIGLGDAANIADSAPALLDVRAAQKAVPPIGASAHKGTRGQVAIVGGSVGMAGAAILAARGALRAGAGLVRAVVADGSLSAVQSAVPEATAAPWPRTAQDLDTTIARAGAVIVGPGLGQANRDLLDLVLAGTSMPAVLDADALNAFAGDTGGLHIALRQRRAILTPHPAECARLLAVTTDDVLANRFDVGLTLARETNAVVVLKGTPTVVSAPDGRVIVAPVGSPVLATGGSGDLLSGITGALLAVMNDAFDAAVTAVWAHGTAAEHVATTRVRGKTLDDVVNALANVWHEEPAPLPAGVLAVLPGVGERSRK